MNGFLDIIWFKIIDAVHYLKGFLDFIFSPLNSLGPAFAVLMVVFVTIVLTKFLAKHYKTKRYLHLEKEFIYWYNIRKEALKCEDYEKGKLLAKNVDQAELNRVYYDYFFERLMNSLVTTYIPLLSMLAYVNETYKQENLAALFGRGYIFKLTMHGGKVIEIGAVFWFVISYLLINFMWFLIKSVYRRHRVASQEGNDVIAQ